MAENEKNNGVSVIICCHNSAPRIIPTLEHLAQQKVPYELNWEIILINNNSTDNTVEVAESQWEKLRSSIPLRTIHEPRPGLSHARTCGIRNAKFEYVLFCDDDNWLDRNYVKLSHEILSTDVRIGVLGGRSEATSNEEIPFWFSTFQKSYAVGVLGFKTGDISKRGEIWGAGMAFRKSYYLAMKEAGFRHLLTDRKGKELSGGGDTELSKWFLICGFKLWYDERLSFKHFIPDERLRKEYFIKLGHDKIDSVKIVRKYDRYLYYLREEVKLNTLKKFILYSYSVLRHLSARSSNEKELFNQRLELFTPFPSIKHDPDIQMMKLARKCFIRITGNK